MKNKWKVTFTRNQRHIITARTSSAHLAVVDSLLNGSVIYSKTVDLLKIPYDSAMALDYEVTATVNRLSGSRRMKPTRRALVKKCKVMAEPANLCKLTYCS